jgi:hypothetical protein
MLIVDLVMAEALTLGKPNDHHHKEKTKDSKKKHKKHHRKDKFNDTIQSLANSSMAGPAANVYTSS